MKTFGQLYEENEITIAKVQNAQSYEIADRKTARASLDTLLRERVRLEGLIAQFGADATPITAIRRTGAINIGIY